MSPSATYDDTAQIYERFTELSASLRQGDTIVQCASVMLRLLRQQTQNPDTAAV